jgi:hypothetical protein
MESGGGNEKPQLAGKAGWLIASMVIIGFLLSFFGVVCSGLIMVSGAALVGGM